VAIMRDADSIATVFEVAPEAHANDPNYEWQSIDVARTQKTEP
jgi:hypothetical protein